MALPNWTELSAQLTSDEFKLHAPLDVLLGEAADVVAFFRKYWSTQRDASGRIVRLGLESANEARLPASTADEIESLMKEIHGAHMGQSAATQPKAQTDAMARARFVLNEITSTLEWLFDDGVEDQNDAQLAALETDHRNDPSTTDALALALEDFAALADLHRSEMSGLGGFDPSLIDEARALVKELRNRSPVPKPTSDAMRQALARRNRLLQLLQSRVDRVRAAARFVFRGSPEIVREAASAHSRKRRAEAKRAKQQAEKGKSQERGTSDDVVV